MNKSGWIATAACTLLVATTLSGGLVAQTKSASAWEYKTLFRTHEMDTNNGNNWSDWESTEDDSNTPLPGTLVQQLNKLGAQGWEVVSISTLSTDARNYNGNNGGTYFQSRTIVLKRPKR